MNMLRILIAVLTAVVVFGIAAVPSLRQVVTPAPQGATVAARPPASETTAPKDVKTIGPNSTSVAKANAGPDAEKALPDAEKKGDTTKAAVEGAVMLMNGGQVQTARKRLLVLAADGSPDVLWALARSFDPTVLTEFPPPMPSLTCRRPSAGIGRGMRRR